MSKQKVAQPHYMVSIYDDPKRTGALLFTFVPKGVVAGEPTREFIVSVMGSGTAASFTWTKPPAREQTKVELEGIAQQRVDARHKWFDRLGKLVGSVKQWATELGWSTKVIEKKMEDPEIGNYKAPALLVQEELIRILLEPVARSAPGTEGLVDLYLMPSYDDIASLYYYSDRWNVHYMFRGVPTVANIREAEAKPLTKATLRKVFDEMKANAE
jgi:hypothetical protein